MFLLYFKNKYLRILYISSIHYFDKRNRRFYSGKPAYVLDILMNGGAEDLYSYVNL